MFRKVIHSKIHDTPEILLLSIELHLEWNVLNYQRQKQ